MRNLKKFLALVLAMVMAFSLMLSASAAANFDDKHFSDTDKVTQAFKEAVAVLTGLDVIQGDGDGDIKDIRPQDTITRAEAAAMVYRIVTGDIKDAQVKLYSDYGHFTDVSKDAWYAGYVGYCQNAGIIKGNTPTTFNPTGKVTGYEVLAMILRAVGYGKNNEFTGSNWQVNVASLGKTKHITDSVSSDQYGYTLNQPARREIVAELLFRGSLIPKVTYSSALGYNEFRSVVSVDGNRYYNTYLANEVFGLYPDGWRAGEWGRPEKVWKADLNPTSEPDREVAVLKAAPKESFYETKRECDVAELMGFSSSKDYRLYVNNDEAFTETYHVVADDQVTKVGGYGRLTEIYTQKAMDEQYPQHDWYSYWATEDGKSAPKDTIVMIDTVAAKVTNVADAVLDNAGHVITPARLTVDLYDNGVNNPDRNRVIQKAAGSKENWDFSIGDVLAIQGYTDNKSTDTGNKNEQDAYSTRQMPNRTLIEGADVLSVTKMEGVTAKQTLVYKNQNKHQVGGEDKFDDLTLYMDKAGDNINTTYVWYYDQYGFVQAIDEASANYGVITSIYAAFGTGDANTNTTGTAKAVATVKFTDGTEGTVEIDRFLVKGDPDDAGNFGTYAGKKTAGAMRDGTSFTTGDANAVELWPMYDFGGTNPMKSVDASGYGLGLINSDFNALLNVAPAAASNMASHTKGDDDHGILFDNLFKFVKIANDQTVAVEVAGTSGNTGIYLDNRSAITSNTNEGKIWKNLGYVTTDNTASTALAWIDDNTQILVRNPDSGVITSYDGVSALPGDVNIVKTDAGTDVNVRHTNEIDWADPDQDGRAEVLYVTGKIDGQTTYGLFYYNDGAAQWNGSTGTVSGFLNGEQETLTFTSYAAYTEVVGNTGTYKGHLYAVEQQMGVVTALMEKNRVMDTTGGTYWSTKLLARNNNGAGTNESRPGYGVAALPNNYNWVETVDGFVTENSFDKLYTNRMNTGSATFQLGGVLGNERYGNLYTTNTRAVYYRDTTAVGGTSYQLTWIPEVIGTAGTVEVRRDANNDGDTTDTGDLVATYYINNGTKIWGMGSGVTFGPSALEYLNKYAWNDVTIVFDATTTSDNTVREIYIATDPDDTVATRPSNKATVPGAGVSTLTNTTIETTQTNAAFQTELGKLSSGVWCNATYKDPAIVSPLNVAKNQLYFSYMNVTAGATAVLTVLDSNNNIVYTKTVGSVAVGSNWISMDFTGVADGSGVWIGSAGLDKGTYSYRININASAIATVSGTFVME